MCQAKSEREKKLVWQTPPKVKPKRNRMDLMGCDIWNKQKIAGELTLILNCWEKCSKLKKHTNKKNIAECRQMETPQSGFSNPNFNQSNLQCLLFWLALFKLQSQSKAKQALECSIWKLHIVYVSCNSEKAISEQHSSKICKQ